MIQGTIDHNLEMQITLQVAGEDVDFVVDTGFNGYLSVSQTLVDRLGLRLDSSQTGLTADGRAGVFHTVHVPVVWHGQPRILRAQVLGEPLIGVRLLDGNELSANWTVGGEFRITPLENQ